MAKTVVEQTITPELARRLDIAIQTLTGRSRSEARAMLEQDCVTLDGRICRKAGLQLEAGQLLVITHDPHTRYREAPRERPTVGFQTVFEDEHIIVVNKSPGILSVQTDTGGQRTLVDSVTEYLRRKHRGACAVPVHRLDRETSGLLVLGKSTEIAQTLMDQFRERKAEREYAVIVAGDMPRRAGTFRSYMATSKRLQRYSVSSGEQGELAITHYEVLRRLQGATYLKAILETGRRNQIRVHLSEAGHPVLGDRRYRPDLASHPDWKGKGLALHAAILGFIHPVSRQPVRFETPLPKEFEKFLRWRKKDTRRP